MAGRTVGEDPRTLSRASNRTGGTPTCSPQFQITIERAEGDRAALSVRLVGPLPLCHLDEIRLKVGPSDDMSRTVTLAGGPSQEQVDAQVGAFAADFGGPQFASACAAGGPDVVTEGGVVVRGGGPLRPSGRALHMPSRRPAPQSRSAAAALYSPACFGVR